MRETLEVAMMKLADLAVRQILTLLFLAPGALFAQTVHYSWQERGYYGPWHCQKKPGVA